MLEKSEGRETNIHGAEDQAEGSEAGAEKETKTELRGQQ